MTGGVFSPSTCVDPVQAAYVVEAAALQGAPVVQLPTLDVDVLLTHDGVERPWTGGDWRPMPWLRAATPDRAELATQIEQFAGRWPANRGVKLDPDSHRETVELLAACLAVSTNELGEPIWLSGWDCDCADRLMWSPARSSGAEELARGRERAAIDRVHREALRRWRSDPQVRHEAGAIERAARGDTRDARALRRSLQRLNDRHRCPPYPARPARTLPIPHKRRGLHLRAIAFTVTLDIVENELHPEPRPLKNARRLAIAEAFGSFDPQPVMRQHRFGRALLHDLGVWPWVAAPGGHVGSDWRSLPRAGELLDRWRSTALESDHAHARARPAADDPCPDSSAEVPALRRAA